MDIVEELRKGCDCSTRVCVMDSVSEKGADEIERLRTDNDRLGEMVCERQSVIERLRAVYDAVYKLVSEKKNIMCVKASDKRWLDERLMEIAEAIKQSDKE